jgi:alpha-beta hydrolase superfamily lysophospholipase
MDIIYVEWAIKGDTNVISEWKKYLIKWRRFLLIASVGILGFSYISACIFLRFQQRYFIYRPHSEYSTLPNASDFNLPYNDVWIPIPGSQEKLHGWWIPSTQPQEIFSVIPNEPTQILKSPKVMLYLCGVGRNMGDYNYLARVAAFRQLGFSVLVFDYRGYGDSQGSFPHESQLYADSQAAWNYLRNIRNIPAEEIIIYGESLGGAIALDLALKHPKASGLIVQSSFTSMLEVLKRKSFSQIIPVDLLLTERFDSLSKVKSLKIPVLFMHGTADSIVPFEMSQKLYTAAPQPKHLFLVSGAEHIRLYKPGKDSYLREIHKFIQSLP